MARGKHANRASNARTEKAEAELAEMKDVLQREREAWKRERADLRNEVQRLQGQLASQVKKLSQESILEAQQQARETVQEKEGEFRQRCIDLFNLFTSIGARFKMEQYAEIASTLGQQSGDLLYHADEGNQSRETLRTTNQKTKLKSDLYRQLDEQQTTSGQRFRRSSNVTVGVEGAEMQ